jgi:Fe2+ or Zn2+ uptake regulation protein
MATADARERIVQETSVEAWDALQSTLSARQLKVLNGLQAFYDRRGYLPTSYELYDAMQAAGQVRDLNDVRPRLTELREMGRVRNPELKRKCHVTQKRAFVWQIVKRPSLFGPV